MNKILKSHFVGIHELSKNLPKILQELAEKGQEVVITKQGKPTAVIIDIEKYLEVQEALKEFSDPKDIEALLEARQEIRSGKGVTAEEVFRQKGL